MAAKKQARPISSAQRLKRTHQRLDREAQKVGPRPVPLEGEFVSRGVKYLLRREMFSALPSGESYFIAREESLSPVFGSLPPIGLLAASALMCAFHDAVAAVPPKMVTGPSEFTDGLLAQQKTRIAQLETQLQNTTQRHEEARHLLKELVRVTIDSVRD